MAMSSPSSKRSARNREKSPLASLSAMISGTSRRRSSASNADLDSGSGREVVEDRGQTCLPRHGLEVGGELRLAR